MGYTLTFILLYGMIKIDKEGCTIIGEIDKITLRNNSPYRVITQEAFLFYETRIVAKLYVEGLCDNEIIKRVYRENLFQYPTEKSLKAIARAVWRRLNMLPDKKLIGAIVEESASVGRQICLYAMMRDKRIVYDFCVDVVGEKFRTLDYSLTRLDMNVFIARLQDRDAYVATWSETTMKKTKSVLHNILTENGYLKSSSDELCPILIDPILKASILAAGEKAYLPAFNCFI